MELATSATAAARPQCRYQQQDCALTLREGLDEYRRANPELIDPDELSSNEHMGELGRFFAAHDACHVLFGLDTSLPDEALADTWTLCGTDARLDELLSYFKSPEHRKVLTDLLREIGWWRVTVQSVATIPRAFRAWWRSRSMTKRWALHEWPDHLDTPLAELRAAYNIRLV